MFDKLCSKFNVNPNKAIILLLFIICIIVIIGLSVVIFNMNNFEQTTVIDKNGNNITYIEGDDRFNIVNNNNEVIHTLSNPGDSINIYNEGYYQVVNQESNEVIKRIIISDSENNINSSFKILNEEFIQATENITFDASESSSVDGEIVNYAWDFGDDSDLEITSEETITHSYDSSGEYTVELTVENENGDIHTYDKIINIKPNELRASAFVNNDTGFTTTEFEFNASDSLSSDEDIEAYVWDFDDGTKSEGKKVTHSYDESGVYTVELEIIDSNSETDTNEVIVQVEDTHIETEFFANETQQFINQDFEFDIVTANPIGTSIESYEWNLGDNKTIMNEYDVIHSYNETGEYTVELKIIGTDKTKGTDSLTVDVRERMINAKIDANTTENNVNETFKLNSSDSVIEGKEIESYEWDFGDNNTDTGESVKHSYNETGEYMVELTAISKDGNESTDTLNLTVESDLTASINVDETQKSTGEVFLFDGEESSANDTKIDSYEWNFGDGTTKQGEFVYHSYEEDEIYVVGLTITGEDGSTDKNTITIEVTE